MKTPQSLACLSENANKKNDGQTTTKGDGQTTTKGDLGGEKGRKKRGASSKDNEKTCPEDFKKVSEMCLHYSESVSKFEESKKYCAKKAKDAEVFSFTNPNEAPIIWKWLGNYVFSNYIRIGISY